MTMRVHHHGPVPQRQWTPDENERFRAMWDNGVSIRKMAHVFQCSLGLINRHCKRLDLMPRPDPIIRSGPTSMNPNRMQSTLPPLPSER
jgi:hypothetical protein